MTMVSGRRQTGFTLIELMVVIAIAALAITLSTPLSNVYKKNRVTSQVHEFVAALNLARSEAITRGNTVSICISDGGTPANCATINASSPNTWEGGWLVFSDLNSDCLITDGADLLLRQHTKLAPNFTLRHTTASCIQYNSNGVVPTSSGLWKLCDPSKSIRYTRGIDLSISGRAQILDDDLATKQSISLANCP
jgi:type IV fimbrial biogenesis protein FimT